MLPFEDDDVLLASWDQEFVLALEGSGVWTSKDENQHYRFQGYGTLLEKKGILHSGEGWGLSNVGSSSEVKVVK